MDIKEIKVGDTASMTKVFTKEDIELYAKVTGDYSDIHLNEDYACTTRFQNCIAHGLMVGGLISGVIGMKLPGNGSIYEKQTFQFLAPVMIDDEITAVVTVEEVMMQRNRVRLSTICNNADGKCVISGEAIIVLPQFK